MAMTDRDFDSPALLFTPEEMPRTPLHLFGQTARSARLAARLSIETLSERTRIRPFYLESLEKGDLAAFVAPIYAIGFARTHARALGLDPDWAEREIREHIATAPVVWRRSGWVS